MAEGPVGALHEVQGVVSGARDGTADRESLLAALAALRHLREEVSGWEPELITAARAAGVSWTALAPALGVASRQAAERRYLRLLPSLAGETTGEARIEAQRTRRASDRAVSDWARRNSASLRKLAGQVSALDGLGEEAQERADRLAEALGDDDPAALLSPLVGARPYLGEQHSDLARQLDAITEYTDQVRRNVTHRRDQPR